MEHQQSDIEKAFYSDGYKLGMQVIEASSTPEAYQTALEFMYANIDSLISSLLELAKQNNQSVDCKLGCEWCCHQPVFALDYELDYLANYIQNYFDEESKEEIRKRAISKQSKLKKLKGEQLINSKHPCPLLRDGACIAYEARPMACRIYLSSNLQSCKTFYTTPEDSSNYPALLDMPMRLGRMMNEGFKAAVKTSGKKVKEYRIEERLDQKL